LVAELAESQKQPDAFEARVCKSKVTLDRVLDDLIEAKGGEDQLAARLDASQTEEGSCSIL
jgi:hypothetical protein